MIYTYLIRARISRPISLVIDLHFLRAVFTVYRYHLLWSLRFAFTFLKHLNARRNAQYSGRFQLKRYRNVQRVYRCRRTHACRRQNKKSTRDIATTIGAGRRQSRIV